VCAVQLKYGGGSPLASEALKIHCAGFESGLDRPIGKSGVLCDLPWGDSRKNRAQATDVNLQTS